MDKWHVLSQEMALENATDEVFLMGRITAKKLRTVYEERRAVIKEVEGRIIGIGVLWETDNPLWFEAGSLWVTPEFRGQKIAAEIYRKRLDLLPSGARCFIVSHNPRVAHLAESHGFSEATTEDWFRLAPYALVCGPCDRWNTDEEKALCPLRAVHGKCRLFVR